MLTCQSSSVEVWLSRSGLRTHRAFVLCLGLSSKESGGGDRIVRKRLMVRYDNGNYDTILLTTLGRPTVSKNTRKLYLRSLRSHVESIESIGTIRGRCFSQREAIDKRPRSAPHLSLTVRHCLCFSSTHFSIFPKMPLDGVKNIVLVSSPLRQACASLYEHVSRRTLLPIAPAAYR